MTDTQTIIIAAAIVAVPNVVGSVLIYLVRHNQREIRESQKELAKSVNGRVDEMVKQAEIIAHAAGVLKGIADEKAEEAQRKR